MGYYSFYKIIKDILQTILGRKILRSILILAIVGGIFFLSLPHKSFAVEIDGITFPDFETLVEQYKTDTGFTDVGVLLFTLNNGEYTLIITRTGFRVDSYFPFWLEAGSNRLLGFWQYRQYKLSSGSWLLFNDYSGRDTTATAYVYNNSETSIYYNSCDIYLNATSTVFKQAETLVPPVNYPEILTSQNNIETLLFDVLSINAKDYSQQDLYLLCYDKNYENTDSLKNLYPVNEILLNQNSKYYIAGRTTDPATEAIYWVNRDELGLNWAIGNTYGFRFAIRVPIENDYSDWYYEYLTEEFDYTISSNVLQDKIDELNAQTKEYEEKQRHDETINSIDNIDNFLRDENVDENIVDLPSDETVDITAEGIDNIFTFLYESFTTGEPQDIVLPIPYTNKTIVISPYYLENIVNQSEFSSLKNLIQLAYWYVIATWVIKDVMNKMEKIKEGEIENVETTNIKGEML